MNVAIDAIERAVGQTTIPGVPLYARGKVRDLYDLGSNLLIVASDRLSAFDVVLPTPIPGRGIVLTQMSRFWFESTRHIVPNHLLTTDVGRYPAPLPEFRDRLEGRSMLVRRCSRIDFECVVRGYITGSLMKEYKQARFESSGDVVSLHGLQFPRDLVESQKLPNPIFTPATKNDSGHDENVSFEHMSNHIGDDLAQTLRRLSVELYQSCADLAAKRGVIIADTKFEFGLDGDTVTLIDEVCSPDSSRFWDSKSYRPGEIQDSFDKQYVRDYLVSIGWDKTPPGPQLPIEVVRQTAAKYRDVQQRIMGEQTTA